MPMMIHDMAPVVKLWDLEDEFCKHFPNVISQGELGKVFWGDDRYWVHEKFHRFWLTDLYGTAEPPKCIPEDFRDAWIENQVILMLRKFFPNTEYIIIDTN